MADSEKTDSIREFFNLWSLYDLVLDRNYMLHNENYGAVARVLVNRFGMRPFSVLELGCGSGRHLMPILQKLSVRSYEGHDLSSEAIGEAEKTAAMLKCPRRLVQGDLRDALRSGTERFDLIFSGLTLHHFEAEERREILRLARTLLRKDGCLLVLDLMRSEGESLPQWLDRYCLSIETGWTDVPPKGIAAIVEHIRGCDHPGTEAEYDEAARNAGFGRSDVHHRLSCYTLWSCE